jgi:uncharacterized membrane protein
MHYSDMSGWVWMTAMMAFWIAVVILLVLVFFRGWGMATPAGRVEKPQDILARRFARGEIGQDEYSRTLGILESQITTRTEPNDSAKGPVT